MNKSKLEDYKVEKDKADYLFLKAIVMQNFRSNSLIKSLTCKCSDNGSKTLFEQS